MFGALKIGTVLGQVQHVQRGCRVEAAMEVEIPIILRLVPENCQRCVCRAASTRNTMSYIFDDRFLYISRLRPLSR